MAIMLNNKIKLYQKNVFFFKQYEFVGIPGNKTKN